MTSGVHQSTWIYLVNVPWVSCIGASLFLLTSEDWYTVKINLNFVKPTNGFQLIFPSTSFPVVYDLPATCFISAHCSEAAIPCTATCLLRSLLWSCIKDAWTLMVNCQKPVFSLGVSQQVHKITNLWKFDCNWLSQLRDNDERQNTLVTRGCMLSDAWFQDLKSNSEVLKSNSWKITFFSRKLCYLRGSRFSHCFILSTSLHYLLIPSKFVC